MPYIKLKERGFYDERIDEIITYSSQRQLKGRVDNSWDGKHAIEEICENISALPFRKQMGHLNYVLSMFIGEVLVRFSDDVCYNLLDMIYGTLTVLENALSEGVDDYWLGWSSKAQEMDDERIVYTLIHRGLFTILATYREMNDEFLDNFTKEILCNCAEPDFFGRRLVGCIGCAKAEFYRRVVAPYEDKNIEENGDVYEVDRILNQ